MSTSLGTDRPFLRLVAALLQPPAHEDSPFVLTAYHEPLALFDVPGERAVVIALDADAPSTLPLGDRLRRIVDAPHDGLLFVVLAGGGAAGREALRKADREAPDPNRLGVYQLEDGRLERIAGRRLGALGAVARWLPAVTPLDPARLPQLLEEIGRERQEQVRFAQSLQGRAVPVTIAVGSVCVLLFVLSMVWGQQEFELALLRMGANNVDLVLGDGQWYRLAAYAFLHGGVIHLLVNMMSLVGLGTFLETLVGGTRYLLLFALTAVAGGAASAFVSGVELSVGASGAIWGLLGAGFALVLRPRGMMPARLAARMRSRLGTVVVANLLISFLPRIDLWAHLGGGIAGFLFALAGGLGQAAPPGADGATRVLPPSTALRAAAIAAGLALVLAIGAALLAGRPWELLGDGAAPTALDPV